jgi:hypothetical protein
MGFMTHDLIRSWLGLPPGEWPPDHYSLLGLEPGEADPARMEQSVHVRLDAVRRYQLIHPEEATEAMNRLAQAFVCLTDPEAKRAYDETLFGTPAEPTGEAESGEPSALDEPPEAYDPLAWLYDPASLVAETPPGPVPASDARAGAEPTTAVAPPLPNSAVPPASIPTPPADATTEAARSLPARRGLGTKRALYQRIVATRGLLHAWDRAGKYLAPTKRRLTRRSEAVDLMRQLTEVRTLLEEFPPVLGRAGQPGYLVVSLARQQLIVPTFQSLLIDQREALSRDWHAGHKLLQAHREFLRQELRALRRRPLPVRAVRAIRASLNDNPGIVLAILALLAVVIALVRTFLLS